MKQISLNDVFPNWLANDGIISKLTELTNVPWKEDISGSDLDLDYHGNRSGNKLISPLVNSLLVNDELSQENVSRLCSVIFSRYGLRWGKLYATLKLEYNPIENYSMVEIESIEREHNNSGTVQTTSTGTVTETGTNTGTVSTTGNDSSSTNSTSNTLNNSSSNKSDSSTNTGTVNTDNSNTTESNDSVFGFNSSSSVPSNLNNSSTSSNQLVTNNLQGTITTTGSSNNEIDVVDERTESKESSQTVTNDLSTSNSTNSNLSDSTSSSDEGGSNENRNLSRSGNIGVTTSQQMIESERELWVWDYFKQIFEDIDSIITIPVYKCT